MPIFPQTEIDVAANYNWTGQHNWTDPLVFGSSPLLQVQLLGNGAMSVRNHDNSENAALRCSVVNSGAYNFWADETLANSVGDLKWDTGLSGLALFTDLVSGVLPVPVFIGSRGAGNTAATSIVVEDVVKLTVAETVATLTTPLTITDGNDPYTLPAADGGASQVMQTDGVGNLSWVTVATGGGEENTASTPGTGAELTLAKSGVDLPFRALVSGDASVTFTENADTLDIRATGAGGGESNTGENVGTGSEWYVGMNGVQLQFRRVQSSDSSVIIAQNTNDISITATATSVGAPTLTAFNNHVGDTSVHFTEASIDHTAIANIGTNSHVQIDAHIASTSNPHSVTALQVGADPSGSADAVQSNLDDHTSNTAIHFTEASIDHTAIGNIGNYSHAVIDTHIDDASIHFADAPSDGSQYAREDGAWTVVVPGSVDLADNYAWTGTHTHDKVLSFTSVSGDAAPTGATATLDLTTSNHVDLVLDGAPASVTVTITPPPQRSAGTIVVEQGGTPSDLIWDVTGATVKWLGDQPTWDDAGESLKDRIVSWRYDLSKTIMYLMASSNG